MTTDPDMQKSGKSRRRGRTWPYVVAVAAAGAIYAYATVEVEADPDASRPAGGRPEIEGLATRDDTNILFVVIDTLRAERMSAYGYERETTPFLKKLASTGIRFGRNIAQSSWTKASMASMWSSRTPLHVGVTRFNHVVPEEVEMPAEILAENGFKTVGLFRNGWVNSTFGFQQGFEKYYKPTFGHRDPTVQQLRPNAQLSGTDESVIADATEFLRIHGESSRWFLYLHLMDVHEYTYDQESALFGNSISDIYDNSVLREDWVVSTLHDYLGRQGLLDETIIVILSDHGEAFGERGFEGHAREVFPETTETPVIISLPFSLSDELVVQTRTNNVDLWPTIFDLIGIPIPEGDLDGRSHYDEIVALSDGGTKADGGAQAGSVGVAEGTTSPTPDSNEEVSIAYLDENWGTPGGSPMPALTALQGEYRYVQGTTLNSRPFEVLLSTKDGQKADQLAANPEVADRLRKLAADALAETSEFESKEIQVDQMQLDQLRALGYQLP